MLVRRRFLLSSLTALVLASGWWRLDGVAHADRLAATAGVGASAAAPLAPGTHRVDLVHDGLRRSYLVHVPPQARAGRALPLMLNFHGGMSSGVGEERFTHMDETADRHGFVVVYPDGTSFAGPLRARGVGGRTPHPEIGLLWNAGSCCGAHGAPPVDDVGFALTAIDDVAGRTGVDRTRVYATGMSNGGMMAHRLAAEAPDRIAAIAGVEGGLVYQPFAPSRPISVLHIHSVDDPRALYAGGFGPSWGNVRVLHPSIPAMMEQWAHADGCSSSPREIDHRRADNGDTATLLAWDGCAPGVEVEHWKLTGAGHVWAGHPAHLPRLLGPDTTVIDDNEEIWKFVSRFHR